MKAREIITIASTFYFLQHMGVDIRLADWLMRAAELQVDRAAHDSTQVIITVILIVIECGIVIPLATLTFYRTIRKASG